MSTLNTESPPPSEIDLSPPASLVRSGVIVSSFTILSRISGLIRDVVVAVAFGASPAADAFFIAFKIPNFFRRMFAEGAFSAGFVPVLSAWRTHRPDQIRDLVQHVTGSLGTVTLLITLLGVLFADYIVVLFAPGYWDQPEQLQLTAQLLRWTFPYLMLISLTALAAGVLNAFQRFAVPAFTPVLLNLSLIAAALWIAPLLDRPIIALGVGVLIAGLVQWCLQLGALSRIGMLAVPKLKLGHGGVREVFTLMLPAIFGASVTQVNLLVDTWIASFLVHGSISWLYYADRLVELPVGVLAVGLATVLLPRLSQFAALGVPQAFSRTLDWAVRVAVLLTLPCAVALFVLAEPILYSIFGYGAFTTFDAVMAGLALQAFSAGLLGFVMIKIFAPGYFAHHDTRTPMRIGLVAVAVNIAMNLLLMWFMGHVGLALATATAALVNAYLLGRGLWRRGILSLDGLAPFALKVAAASVLMGVVLEVLQSAVGWESSLFWIRALCLAGICVAGGTLYAVALWALGMRPAQFRAPS